MIFLWKWNHSFSLLNFFKDLRGGSDFEKVISNLNRPKCSIASLNESLKSGNVNWFLFEFVRQDSIVCNRYILDSNKYRRGGTYFGEKGRVGNLIFFLIPRPRVSISSIWLVDPINGWISGLKLQDHRHFWNNLSKHVKSSASIDIFKERLKTELFACYS